MSFEFSELREGILEIFAEAQRAQWVGRDIGVRTCEPQKAQGAERVRRPPPTRAERRARELRHYRERRAAARLAWAAEKAARLAAEAARSPQLKISVCAACGARSQAHRCAA